MDDGGSGEQAGQSWGIGGGTRFGAPALDQFQHQAVPCRHGQHTVYGM